MHVLRALGLAALIALLTWGGIEVNGGVRASALVESLKSASTVDVSPVIKQLSGYRRWANPRLVRLLGESEKSSRDHLHASLALLPVADGQVEYLFQRLQDATADEVPVLRDALKIHQSTLTPKLWTVLDSAKPGDISLLPAASALASYAPDDARWEAVGGKVAEALVSVNSLLLRPWFEALRPVRGKLTAPLATIFRDKNRSESDREQVTDILTDYASDDPDRIADLLMVSDSKAYLSLFLVAEKSAEQVLPVFQAELAKKATYSWNDPPLNPSWMKPDAALVSRIESAEGLLSERFAFCQTMAMDEFLTTAEALRKSGYRPVRFRPHADGQQVRVAAVWTRDGRNWRMGSGLSPEQVRQDDEKNRSAKFLPVDVAGYVETPAEGKSADRYAALWVQKVGDDDARLYVGATADEEGKVHERLKDEKLTTPRTLHGLRGSDGRKSYSGVWGVPPSTGITGQVDRDQFEGNFEQNQARLSDQTLVDVAVSAAGAPQTVRERARKAIDDADETLKAKPDDPDARLSRARANLRLGANQKALDDLNTVIGKDKENVDALRYRAIALARLGKRDDALADLAKFQKKEAPEERSKLSLATVVAAELGEGADKAIESLDAALQKQPQEAELRYDAAGALALASKAISRTDKEKGRKLADRALGLLREALNNHEADFSRMDDDPNLDPVRDDPSFAEVMKAGHPDRRYAAVWTSDPSFEATPIYGLDPEAHLAMGRELIAQGYRPVSCSVSRTTPEGTPLTASLWQRPVVKEEVKDQLAGRQAKAAVALVRLGKADEIWPLLKHSADPRLRSFILNWLAPFGADPRTLVAELDRIDANNVGRGSPDPAQSTDRRSPASGVATDSGRPSVPGRAGSGDPRPTNAMDAVLFHPETSTRRALILALGTYGTDRLSPGERKPLIGKLLDLYRNDPDAGVHGAAEWTLRKWENEEKENEEKLKGIDAELSKLKDHGERRWFVSSLGLTFTVIDGPVELLMGSPATEPDRESDETPHQVVIPRRFAIAAKEISVEQYQRFMKDSSTAQEHQISPSRYSPDPKGPMNNPSWYDAAAFCNWLSAQEGLPADQWCYLRTKNGIYAAGMTIPADVLRRKGYRLPTEAEWEYACRSGTITSRYHGLSVELLARYAWYQANSRERAWSCGSLLPNELGLFDTLGSVYEWVQDEYQAYKPGRAQAIYDIIRNVSHINESDRLLRGGAFLYPAVVVRSAVRYRGTPSYRDAYSGFRLARTYP